jgi:hypothetical protein
MLGSDLTDSPPPCRPATIVSSRRSSDRGRTLSVRAAVILRHYLGLSLEDTAGVLGGNVGTAKSQTSRGLARLRELMAMEKINLSGDPTAELSHAVA